MDNMSNTNLKIALVFVTLGCLYSMMMWNSEINQKIKLESEVEKLKVELKKTQEYSDSLYMELFPTQIELGRYEVALDILRERNPKAASQYGDIISEETE